MSYMKKDVDVRDRLRVKVIDTCKDKTFFLFSGKKLSVVIINFKTSMLFETCGFKRVSDKEFKQFIRDEEKSGLHASSFLEVFFPDSDSLSDWENITEYNEFCKLFRHSGKKYKMTFSEYIPTTFNSSFSRGDLT